MLIVTGKDGLARAVADAVKQAYERATNEAQGFLKGYQTLADLQKQITKLEVERDKKQEEWDRREREVEHKVGLERKRQEFEIAQAKRETEVKVREENLAADKERFKSEMDFQRKHLEGEIGSLRTLVGQLLERLPSAEIIANVGGKK